MAYPKYVVTYVVMTEEAGANPFWHASILMSEQLTEHEPLEVKDAFGFYSTYPSSTTNPVINTLKNWLGFKIDLQDSHGHLEKEKMRFLDGQGLQGISFDVDKTKYDALHDAYHRAKNLENEAIDEYNKLLIQEGSPVNGHYRWLKELEQVNQHQREARLYPFHIDWSFSWSPAQFGFTTDMSYTCKARALDLLRATDIITDDHHQQISASRATRAFPRASDLPLAPIQLLSTGDRKVEKKHWNRTWENNNHLFWANKPKLITESPPVTEQLSDENRYYLIKNMLLRMNKVEQLLHQQIADYQQQVQKEEPYRECCMQLKRLQEIRERFIATANNQTDRTLTRDLYFAEKAVNIARMTLTPEKANYSFLARALENIALQYALLGLLTVIVAASLLTGVAGILVTTGASLFAGYQFYAAINTDKHLTTMRDDYLQYHHSHKSTATSRSPLSPQEVLTPLSPTFA